jgi:hypothetical protein
MAIAAAQSTITASQSVALYADDTLYATILATVASGTVIGKATGNYAEGSLIEVLQAFYNPLTGVPVRTVYVDESKVTVTAPATPAGPTTPATPGTTPTTPGTTPTTPTTPGTPPTTPTTPGTTPKIPAGPTDPPKTNNLLTYGLWAVLGLGAVALVIIIVRSVKKRPNTK